MTSDHTGYEGPERDDEKLAHIDTWELTLFQEPGFSSEDYIARLMCNDVSRGVIYLQNNEEFEWLSKRIKGDRVVKRSRESLEKG